MIFISYIKKFGGFSTRKYQQVLKQDWKNMSRKIRKPKVVKSGDMIEATINYHLVEAWNQFVKLKSTHPAHGFQFASGIHACQSVLMWRELQRLKPDKYRSI